jgi:hypothetical protein
MKRGGVKRARPSPDLGELQHLGKRAPEVAELFDYLEDVLLWMSYQP